MLNTASCVLAARGGFWIWIWRCNSFGSSYIKMVNSTNVRHAATAYRRGTHPTNTTNDKRWGGKLKQYEGADRERRLDDKDNKFAIVHPDQEPADYEQWVDYLYKDGMNDATRKIIVSDVAGASWSHVGRPFSGNRADCRFLAEHKCAIAPWNSKHYEGQRKLPPKGHKKAASKTGGATIKKAADDAHRQGEHFSHMGAPSKTPGATFAAGNTLQAANVQLTRGADRLASARQRKADPDAFLPAHKIVEGKRGEHRCQVFQTDVLDAGGKVGREHDHETGIESVMTVGHTPNTSIVEPIRDLRKRGASL